MDETDQIFFEIFKNRPDTGKTAVGVMMLHSVHSGDGKAEGAIEEMRLLTGNHGGACGLLLQRNSLKSADAN